MCGRVGVCNPSHAAARGSRAALHAGGDRLPSTTSSQASRSQRAQVRARVCVRVRACPRASGGTEERSADSLLGFSDEQLAILRSGARVCASALCVFVRTCVRMDSWGCACVRACVCVCHSRLCARVCGASALRCFGGNHPTLCALRGRTADGSNGHAAQRQPILSVGRRRYWGYHGAGYYGYRTGNRGCCAGYHGYCSGYHGCCTSYCAGCRGCCAAFSAFHPADDGCITKENICEALRRRAHARAHTHARASWDAPAPARE
jgi:hypothetical protein